MTFSENGAIVLTEDAGDLILVLKPADNSLDYIYKATVPPNGKHAAGGPAHTR